MPASRSASRNATWRGACVRVPSIALVNQQHLGARAEDPVVVHHQRGAVRVAKLPRRGTRRSRCGIRPCRRSSSPGRRSRRRDPTPTSSARSSGSRSPCCRDPRADRAHTRIRTHGPRTSDAELLVASDEIREAHGGRGCRSGLLAGFGPYVACAPRRPPILRSRAKPTPRRCARPAASSARRSRRRGRRGSDRHRPPARRRKPLLHVPRKPSVSHPERTSSIDGVHGTTTRTWSLGGLSAVRRAVARTASA